MTPYPSQFKGKGLIRVAGKSLVPALRGASMGERELYFEHQGNAAARIGHWKIVRAHGKPWELYDLAADRTELNDLSNQRPEKLAELKAKWQTWATDSGVQSWPIKKKRQ